MNQERIGNGQPGAAEMRHLELTAGRSPPGRSGGGRAHELPPKARAAAGAVAAGPVVARRSPVILSLLSLPDRRPDRRIVPDVGSGGAPIASLSRLSHGPALVIAEQDGRPGAGQSGSKA